MKRVFTERPFSVRLPKGMRRVLITEIQGMPTPPANGHVPVSHYDFASEVITAVLERGLVIRETLHAIGRKGNSYFGMLDVRSKSVASSSSWVVGLVNENGPQHLSRIVSGCRLLASNVVGFTGDVDAVLKHNGERQARSFCDDSTEQLWTHWSILDQRLDAMRCHPIDMAKAHHIVMTMALQGAIAFSDIRSVIKTYDNPEYEIFAARCMWSLYNAALQSKAKAEAPTLIRSTTKITNIISPFLQFSKMPGKFIQPELL